jgi:hypothetical protein
MEGFNKWWDDTGSGIPIKHTEDVETFAKRISSLSWAGGASEQLTRKKKRRLMWRRLLPYLMLYIDLGFITVRTSIAYREKSMAQYEYIQLTVKVFGKGFEFGLYTTDKRIIYRG